MQTKAILNGFELSHQGVSIAARVYTIREAELAALMPKKKDAGISKHLLCPMPGLVKTIDVDVPDLGNPGKTIKKPCSFFTGYTLIDINWDRTVFLKGIAIKTVEVVLADEQGNLVIHNLALDTASTELKELQAETAKVAPVVVPRPHPTTKPVHGPSPVRPPPGTPPPH